MIFLVLSLFMGPKTFAKANTSSQFVYGPEWTFTNHKFINKQTTVKWREKALSDLAKYYSMNFTSNSRISKFTFNEFRIDFIIDNKIHVAIQLDPGVLEVTTSPLTLDEWKKYGSFFDEVIFKSMNQVGMQPHEREGAGHINIGLHEILKTPSLLFRFLADYLRFPGFGIAMNSLSANQQDAIDLTEFSDLSGISTEERYAQLNLLTKENPLKPISIGYDSILQYFLEKYVALGLRKVNKTFQMVKNNSDLQLVLDFSDPEARIEMRQNRPQSNMQDYIKVLEIYQARLIYLINNPKQFNAITPQVMNDGWRILGQFADYIDETGLNWRDYISLLPKVWQNLPEKYFIRDKKTSSKRTRNQCINLF